jgi:hypothetical protein
VIKPALVGLAGPWLSGGIEFNWPQHHRPGTYCPVDYAITANRDGSRTLWLSEIEPMWHLKGTLGLTLFPGRALLEIQIRLFNPTRLPQSFHLWTNPAVHVNERYQSVFPPDVRAVYDHGKRDSSAFPIARGEYYKVDYSRGVDISWYKNLPVPTSFMAARSDYDFIGGYDHGRRAGVLHVADHHFVPGKKQWVWGCGDFGRAWDRNLTDGDGPYAELMCGISGLPPPRRRTVASPTAWTVCRRSRPRCGSTRAIPAPPSTSATCGTINARRRKPWRFGNVPAEPTPLSRPCTATWAWRISTGSTTRPGRCGPWNGPSRSTAPTRASCSISTCCGSGRGFRPGNAWRSWPGTFRSWSSARICCWSMSRC